MPPSESLKLPLFSEVLIAHFTIWGRGVEEEEGCLLELTTTRFPGQRDMGFVEGRRVRLMVKDMVVTGFGGFDFVILLFHVFVQGKYSSHSCFLQLRLYTCMSDANCSTQIKLHAFGDYFMCLF